MSLSDIDCRAIVPRDRIFRLGAQYAQTPCLFHADTHPSMRVYADGAYCPVCRRRANIVELYQKFYGASFDDAIEALRGLEAGAEARATPRPVQVARIPDQDLGRRLHQALTDEAVAYYVLERGLTLDSIARYQLGWGALYPGGPEGYTIPIYRDGKLRQVKQRLPHAERDKYRSIAGCGTHLYLGDDLAYQDRVILVEGEFDAIVLRQHGYLAATSTGGAGTFDEAWVRLLTGSTVYACFDRDAGGDTGFDLVRRYRKGRLKRIVLPPKVKDPTDFFLTRDPAEFDQLILDADHRHAIGRV